MSFFSFQDIISCTTGIMVLITLLLTMELLTRKPQADDHVSNTLDEAVAKAANRRDELKGKVAGGSAMLASLAGGQTITQTQVTALRDRVAKLRGDNRTLADEISKARRDFDIAGDKAGNLEKTIGEISKKIRSMEDRISKSKLILNPNKLVGKGIPGMTPLWVECSAGEFVVTRIVETGSDKGLAKLLERCDTANPLDEFLAWASAKCDPRKEYFVLLFRPDAADKWLTTRAGLGRLGFKVNWNIWPAENSLHPRLKGAER